MKLRRKSLILYVFLFLAASLLPISTKAASPSLNKTSASVYVGKNLTLKVNNKSSKQKVTWKSSNTAIATVSSKGTITGKKAGTVTITATVGSKKLKCTVKVKDVLTVDTHLIAMPRAGYKTKVKVDLALFGNVKFKISDVSIVSASWGNYTGFPTYLTVTGKKKGTTYITISNTANSQTVRIKVHVMDNASSESDLGAYIQKKGKLDASGIKYLEYTEGSTQYRVFYNKNKQLTLQMINKSTKVILCSIEIYDPYAAVITCQKTFKGTARINPSKFRTKYSDILLDFNVDTGGNHSYTLNKKIEADIASYKYYTLTTLLYCQKYLFLPNGFTLKSFGFEKVF